MCVSQHIFCCFCRGNFEYCTRLTVKSVIHPLVDLPSVLALKTNNLSLDWVYSCLDSGRKTGRLKKIRPLAALVLIFSLHYLHKCCVPWKPTLWQSSGSDIVIHTHMKNRWKRREKMEKEDECVSFKRTKGEKREKKKTYWWCEFRVNELAKFSGHNNADIQANFQLHTDLSLNTFIKKKRLQNWSKMLRLPRKIKEQSCLSCVRNERKKNPKPAEDDMIPLCSCR